MTDFNNCTGSNAGTNHTLIVTQYDDDGEFDYELRHPDDCPKHRDDLLGGYFHDCDFSGLWVQIGHDSVSDVETLAPGEYPIRICVQHTLSSPYNGGEEWDSWIEVIN